VHICIIASSPHCSTKNGTKYYAKKKQFHKPHWRHLAQQRKQMQYTSVTMLCLFFLMHKYSGPLTLIKSRIWLIWPIIRKVWGPLVYRTNFQVRTDQTEAPWEKNRARAREHQNETNLSTTIQRCIVVDCSYSVLKISQIGPACTTDGNHLWPAKQVCAIFYHVMKLTELVEHSSIQSLYLTHHCYTLHTCTQ